MSKKSAKQKKLNRNKKLFKRKVKSKEKSKAKIRTKSHKKSVEPQLDEMFTKEEFQKSKSIHQTIENTFSVMLKEYSKIDTTSIFSALLLNPDYQASQYRFEKAISVCLSFCEGDKKPNQALIKFIFEKVSELFGYMDDPAEDVFISTLWFENEQYKLSTGLWEGGIYQTQIFLDVINDAPSDEKITVIKNRLRAILKASDFIITKAGLRINEIGAEYPITEIDDEISNIDELINKVKLQPFIESELLPCIEIKNLIDLYKQEFGASDLEETPFFINDGSCSLIFPSSILVCIKRQIINFFRNNYSIELLNTLFYNRQEKRIYETKLLREFKHLPIKFFKTKGPEDWGYFESIIEFNKGYYYHFVFLSESFSLLDSDWFNGFTQPDDYLSKYIEKSILKAKNWAIEKSGGRKGCTVIVPCGYGRGLGLGLRFKSDEHWMFTVINSHDLDTLSNDLDCKPHKVWRIIESLEQLTVMGVKLLNPNGFLNLYAYAKENDFCLVPHESFQETGSDPSNVVISIPLNCQAKLREKVEQGSERLSVFHHELGVVRVVKGFSDSLFSNNEKNNIYCLEEININIFQCVYVDNDSDFKIWIEQEINRDFDYSIQYQCFEAAVSWVEKIFAVLKHDGLSIPSNLLAWNLSFDLSEDMRELRDCPKPENVLSCFSSEFSDNVLYSNFGPNFFDGLRLGDNFSEQTLVLSLISYICDFNKFTDCKSVLNRVIESSAARHIHLFVANQYREYFISDKEEPIYIEQTDANNIKLNLGWSCRDRSQGNLIEGKDGCKKYLNQLVGNIWEIIKKKLMILDREFLIYTLLVNMEVSDHQKARWKRTFKANLALQSDKDDLYSVVNKKISVLNGASLSSRLVIEMAICECPLIGGREAGVLDIQELICLASLMHHMGGLSEAINYDAIEPEVVISTFGDVMFNQNFDDNTLKLYAYKLNESALASSVDEYEKHLTENEPVKAVNNIFEVEFSKAWVDEFGFTIDDVRLFIDALEDYGLKKDTLVYKISYDNLVKIFDEETIIITERIIQELVIFHRDSWTNIPHPFKSVDWQPWRFRRRFSLILRPLVQYDDTNFYISPQHIRNAFNYLVRSCYYATLDENHFSSKLMKKWIGNARGRNGLAFNTKVAKRLQELGWTVREEIKLPEILNQKLDDFGDVDVLAWNEKSNVVAVIECKDLDFAKTQGEIARQLYDFKGQANEKGKKDRLLKHIYRVNELNENLEKISTFTGITSDISLKGYVVFSNTVPMVFDDNRLYKDMVEFLTFEQLEQLD